MSGPIQTCQECGDVEHVKPDGRGFPPDIAKRKLAKRCKARGHTSRPLYRAGFAFGGPITGMTAPPVPGSSDRTEDEEAT